VAKHNNTSFRLLARPFEAKRIVLAVGLFRRVDAGKIARTAWPSHTGAALDFVQFVIANANVF